MLRSNRKILSLRQRGCSSSSSTSGSGSVNVKYYIPLCERPFIPVTVKMLDSVEPLESDKEPIKKFKHALRQELNGYLGEVIVQDTPHLYRGQVVRFMLYSGVWSWVVYPFDAWMTGDLLFLSFPLVLYAIYSYYLYDASTLHRAYKIIVEQQ